MFLLKMVVFALKMDLGGCLKLQKTVNTICYVTLWFLRIQSLPLFMVPMGVSAGSGACL